MYDIKILNQDYPLWLSVDKEDNLTLSNMPISFLISYITFLNQIAYQISSGSCNFVVKFEWVVENKYDEFYLVDLNTEEEPYYALDKSTLSSRFKKQPTNEDFLIEIGELKKNVENIPLEINNALNYIIGTCNVEKNASFVIYVLLMMPQLSVVPEFLKIALPFISSTELLDQKVNEEILELHFETGPTRAIAT
ncbi:hypothetical protein F8M41_022318 [Gigaspora margarita]|uniref:Uncharacterized protein n=1 Tax=Gigaspora margarita TaxID=4874 RepID=A0A8H4EI60_GIGMA|nr:hypothetical protein F8M41_022318 [Gigaspora margarita]